MAEDLVNHGAPFVGASSTTFGMSRAGLRRLIEGHRVRRLFRGVYVDAAVPDTRALRAAALHLVKPEGGVFYGPTAAYLRGVDAFPPGERFDFTPQCIVPHHDGRSKRPTVRCREGYLPDADLEEVEGLVVTTSVRTTVDMLRSLWRPYALSAADSMAHAGWVSPEEVLAYVRTLRRYPGIVQARALAVLIEPKVESPGESWQRLRVVDAGLPLPESQISIRNRFGEEMYRLDNGYRDSKVGMEYDGREWHDDDHAKRHDEDRRTFIQESLGWRLAVSRRSDILGDDPAFERQVGSWIGIEPGARRW